MSDLTPRQQRSLLFGCLDLPQRMADFEDGINVGDVVADRAGLVAHCAVRRAVVL